MPVHIGVTFGSCSVLRPSFEAPVPDDAEVQGCQGKRQQQSIAGPGERFDIATAPTQLVGSHIGVERFHSIAGTVELAPCRRSTEGPLGFPGVLIRGDCDGSLAPKIRSCRAGRFTVEVAEPGGFRMIGANEFVGVRRRLADLVPLESTYPCTGTLYLRAGGSGPAWGHRATPSMRLMGIGCVPLRGPLIPSGSLEVSERGIGIEAGQSPRFLSPRLAA